jgi:hypothetical protein
MNETIVNINISVFAYFSHPHVHFSAFFFYSYYLRSTPFLYFSHKSTTTKNERN